MTITIIDRPALQSITEQFVAELKDVADRLGLDIQSGGGTYGTNTGAVKINLSIKDTGTGKGGLETEFGNWARRYGIDPNAFGKTFRFGKWKEPYEICGVYPTSPKYRFAAKDSRGRTYKFTPETLREHFPAPSAA